MTSVPFLTNHSLGYADAKCTLAALSCLTIGNGKSVVAQYPLPDTQVLSDQRVLLLTSQENVLMPEMTGWSRRDVLAFFALTHIPVTINGEGNVSSQSVAANTALDASVMVEITLK
jgi:penicillin-binding protein 2B